MFRSVYGWFVVVLGLPLGSLFLAGYVSAVPNPPPVQCTQCNCIYVKGWWLSQDGSYKAFCTQNTFNPVYTGTSCQSFNCPNDGAGGTQGAGNADRVNFKTGNNTCNVLVPVRGNSLIPSVVATPIGIDQGGAGVTIAQCLNGQMKPIPFPTD
jgi:hypothetical protein